MGITERRCGEKRVYSDNTWINRSDWGRLLDTTDYAVKVAVEKSGARVVNVLANTGAVEVQTPVADFPKMMRALLQMKSSSYKGIEPEGDLGSNFKIRTPLGTNLAFRITDEPITEPKSRVESLSFEYKIIARNEQFEIRAFGIFLDRLLKSKFEEQMKRGEELFLIMRQLSGDLLSDREKLILERKFRLGDNFTEIGISLDISCQRVRQNYIAGLRKLWRNPELRAALDKRELQVISNVARTEEIKALARQSRSALKRVRSIKISKI